MSTRRPVVLQFVDGVFALPRAAAFLLATRAAWPYALVPVLICSALCVLSIASAIELVPQLMAAIWPGMHQTLGELGTSVINFIAVLLSALIGLFLAVFLTPPLSAPALERLVIVRELELGAPPRTPAGFLRELRAAVAAQIIATCVFTPVILVLTIITWVVPPAAVVTVPLKFLVLAIALSWSLLDYPLSLRGAPVNARVRLMFANSARVLGFGLAVAAVFMVPLLPLLLLPTAVAAAAEITVDMERDYQP